MNKTWSDGIVAAHEPYLVTMNGAGVVLWNRRILEPFSVSKEPYIRKIIILAENLEVPGESSSVGLFVKIHVPWLSSVCFYRIKTWVSLCLYWQLSQPIV